MPDEVLYALLGDVPSPVIEGGRYQTSVEVYLDGIKWRAWLCSDTSRPKLSDFSSLRLTFCLLLLDNTQEERGMRTLYRIYSLAALMLLIAGFAIKADAQRTFVIPHYIERVGLVNTTQFTFDTTFFVTYLGGIGSTDLTPGASIDLFIFDDLTGLPLKSATNIDVCNPCSFTVNTSNRKAIGNVEGLANSVGGLPRPDVTGSMLLIAAGDVEGVGMVSHVVNSHTSPQDLSSLPLLVQPGQPITTTITISSTLRPIPFHEDSVLPNQPVSFSTDLHAFYAAGLPGTTPGNGATVNLRLYDDLTGLPLLSLNNQPVCNPCTVNLTTAARKHLFSLDALIRNAGGFPRPDVRGFATVEVTGDKENVSVEDIEKNNHTSANDVEFTSATPAGFFVPGADPFTGNVFVVPHVLETQGKITDTPFAFDTSIFMTYTPGLPGFPPGGGATVEVFLFDQTTGLPMKTATNQDVCNPCTSVLSPTNRRGTIVVEDEIVAKGGFGAQTDRRGFGVFDVSGVDPDGVNIQTFIFNSHTGPSDISLFAPRPVRLEPRFEFRQPRMDSSRGAPIQSSVPDDMLRGTTNTAAPEARRRVLTSEYNFPHFRDRTGKASNTTFTFDSEFHAVYNGTDAATLELYLYDQMTSLPLMSLTNQPVCNPCNLPLNTTTRKRRIIIDDLITAAGGFPRLDVAGFAKIRVTGDAGSVGILGMLINAHSGPNDLSTSELLHRLSVRRTTDFDFNGDGRADIGVFRPNDPLGAMFYLLQTGNDQFNAFRWGSPDDRPVTEDYDGDNKTDIAVWRPTLSDEANFFIFLSASATVRAEHFGITGDNPSVTGDFDGDDKADPAVYRNGASPGAQSFFFYRPSASPGVDFRAMPWGLNGDEAVKGDFDGDGKLDLAVFRASDQCWYILFSSNAAFRVEKWGLPTDVRVPRDYDGDGRTDLAVFRNGIWYILQSSNGGIRIVNWGLSTDKVVPADYDGDGKTDPAVWRPSLGGWYILRSSGSDPSYTKFGSTGDSPLSCFPDESASCR